MSRPADGAPLRRIALGLWVAASVAAGLLWSLPSLSKQLDLGSFLVSSEAAWRGDDPYGRYPAVLGIGEAYEGIAPVNLNPPISLLVVGPLTWMPPLAAAWCWYLASLLLVAASMGILARTHPGSARLASAGAISLYAVWSCQQRGQLYALVLLLVASAWGALHEGRRGAAGALMGAAAAIKPQLLVWPVLLGIAGDRRTPLAAAGSAGALTLAPLLIFGPAAFPSWTGAPGGRRLPLSYPGNMSLWSIAARLGVPELGALLSVALLAGVAVWAWRRGASAPVETTGAVALLAATIASPVSWLGYAMVLLPVGFAHAARREVRAAALMLGVPPVALLTAFLDAGRTASPSALTSGTACGLVLAGLLAAFLRDGRDHETTTTP